MSKARDLADFISTGSILSDGTIESTEISGVTATANELNVLDGISVTTEELNNVAGVNSDVQTQLDGKQDVVSGVSDTEIGYLDGVSSAIQAQLDGKVATTAIGTTVQAYDANLTSFVTAVDLPTSDGTAGQVLTTDGIGGVTFADAGGGGGTYDFVASGAISNGDLVGLNPDGTVSVLQAPFVEDTFAPQTNVGLAVAYDTNSNKVVIAYRDYDNGSVLTVIVGDISGNSISFGTAVAVTSVNIEDPTMVFDSNSNKVVICYRNMVTNKGEAVVGTVSGTSISFGTAVEFVNFGFAYDSVFDSISNKVVVTYLDFDNNDYGTAIVGEVSGTSISFGTPVVFRSITGGKTTSAFDSNSNKVVVSYFDQGSNYYGTSVVGTVSGTSISFGTPVVFSSEQTFNIVSTFDSNNNKVVIAYRDQTGNSDNCVAVVGTFSGTSISFGTPAVVPDSNFRNTTMTFNSNTNKAVIVYVEEADDHKVQLIEGTVSGTSISLSNSTSVTQDGASVAFSTFDPDTNRVLISFRERTVARGEFNAVDISAISLFNAWTGIAAEDISDAATGAVTVVSGVNEGQTGLSPSTTYYLANNGTLSTTGVPTRVVGRALSSTSLLITSGNVTL